MAILYDLTEVRPGFVYVHPPRTVAPRDGVSFHLEELYALLRCSTIEIVRCRDERHILVIDEEGKLPDPPRPYNTYATPLALIPRGDFIAGPALFCEDGEVR